MNEKRYSKENPGGPVYKMVHKPGLPCVQVRLPGLGKQLRNCSMPPCYQSSANCSMPPCYHLPVPGIKWLQTSNRRFKLCGLVVTDSQNLGWGCLQSWLDFILVAEFSSCFPGNFFFLSTRAPKEKPNGATLPSFLSKQQCLQRTILGFSVVEI